MMKWWGWGDPEKSFPADEKAALWPWSRVQLGITEDVLVPPVPRDSIRLPPPKLDAGFCASLSEWLGPERMLSGEDERLLHSYGKSYPDLFRVRRGEVRRAPDLVCLPESHAEVEKLLSLAHRHDVAVIPFGGGTNIVGGINPSGEDERMCVSLDMRRMSRVLSIDEHSLTATIEGGARGPELEEMLLEKGFSLGHYPDSFEYSTLGGWLATRSAGMQSDAYGRIEDMVVALRCVTPSGTIVTRPVPASSAGPDLNRLVVGSEGVLGVITEATMRIHRVPEKNETRAYLFRSFPEGVAAIHGTIERGLKPSLIRLQDANETELAFRMKSPRRGIDRLAGKLLKRYLALKGYSAPCLLLVGFEGEKTRFRDTKKRTQRILKKHGAIPLGAGVGETWSKDKFNVPYLRDFIMDYGCMVDVAETSTVWSNVLPLYGAALGAVNAQFARDGMKGYACCHISHTYETGACLYFTYACRQKEGKELEHYYRYKKLMTETFLDNGGALTHHHAVGTEHLPWIEREVSRAGMKALKAVKASLDPKGICNPGKLVTA